MTTQDDIHAILREWQGRPTVAVVDLDQFAANIRAFRAIVGESVRMQAVVKADGYGHGSVPIAKAAMLAGADELGVATVEEGVVLREAGITAPILVLGPIGTNERRRAIAHDLALTIANAAFALALAADVRTSGRKDPLPVHLKIDTGMHRFGGPIADVPEIARTIDRAPELRLAGVMTHFACADDPDPSWTAQQAAEFDRACEAIRASGIEVHGQHLANSAGTLRFPDYHRDRVRIGIAMYGLLPDASMTLPEPIRPVMTVHSRLSRIVDLQPGDRVSYGGTWTAAERCRVGLVAIGYADGYRRQGSNLAWMDVRDQAAPVRGRVCMDQTMIELPPNAELGDHVTVVGNGHDGVAPTLDRLAEMYGTIPYELATALVPHRLVHLYVQHGRLVAIRDVWGYRELDEDALAQPARSVADSPAVV